MEHICAVTSPRPVKKRPPVKTKVNSVLNLIRECPQVEKNDPSAQVDDSSVNMSAKHPVDGQDDVPLAVDANADVFVDNLDVLPMVETAPVLPPVSRSKTDTACATSKTPTKTTVGVSSCSTGLNVSSTSTKMTENPVMSGILPDHSYTMPSIGSSETSTPSHPVFVTEKLGQSKPPASIDETENIGVNGSSGPGVVVNVEDVGASASSDTGFVGDDGNTGDVGDTILMNPVHYPQQQTLSSNMVSQSFVTYVYNNPLCVPAVIFPHNTTLGNRARDCRTGAGQPAPDLSVRAKSVRRKPNILLSRTLNTTGDYKRFIHETFDHIDCHFNADVNRKMHAYLSKYEDGDVFLCIRSKKT